MKQDAANQPVYAVPALPASPSVAYRLQLADKYKRVVSGANVRAGAMKKDERAEILQVWMEYQNVELFKPLFERADVAPVDVGGLIADRTMKFLMASADADRQLGDVFKALKALPAESVERLLPLMEALHRKQIEAGVLCDSVRYAQAAELELLRPLAWRP